jgi:hypothetical protein
VVTWNDYIGKRFGWYEIAAHIGFGTEAEVFMCINMATMRGFVLKLYAEDDAAWAGPDVQLPPLNGQSNKHSIVGTIRGRRSPLGAPNSPIYIPEMFQVIDSRYLAPLTNTFKVRGAMSITDLVAIPPSRTMTTTLWEDLTLLLKTDMGLLKRDDSAISAFRERWQTILYGSCLGKDALESAVSRSASANVDILEELVKGQPAEGPDVGPVFEETLLCRLYAAWAGAGLSMDAVSRTLECPFIRENVTIRDLYCLVSLFRIVNFSRANVIGTPLFSARDVTFFENVARILSKQPLEYESSPSSFEEAAPVEDAVLVKVQTAVQEYIGDKLQPFPTLGHQ